MNRPLSPHLQIYKPQITSVISILHRFAGIGLYFLNVLFLFFWLWGAYQGPEVFYSFQSHFWVRALFMAWCYMLSFYVATEVRYMFWDFGLGFELCTVKKTAYTALLVAFIMGTFFWVKAFGLL